MIAVERKLALLGELKEHAADARARGLEGERLVEDVVQRMGLEAVSCPGCRGRGGRCKVCSGDGFVFKVKPRAEA